METIRGRMSHALDFNGLKDRLTSYDRVMLDLGTGDGRYVRTLAEKNSDAFIIGVDSCRENLSEYSGAKLPNMLFVIANAQDLPHELNGLVSHITINFPWGSLLECLLAGEAYLLSGISSIARQRASLDICLNGGALAENGVEIIDGAAQIQHNLAVAGWKSRSPIPINIRALQSFPSTWARRLAHGRDPRALIVRSTRI